jgi:hypothetical protein
MKKQLSDEQLDLLLSRIVADATAGDDEVDQIASSPALWWSIQREIRSTENAVSPWPPVVKYLRWFFVAVPAAAAVIIAAVVLIGTWSSSDKTVATADTPAVINTPSTATEPTTTAPVDPVRVSEPAASRTPADRAKPARAVLTVKKGLPKAVVASNRTTREEIKTDFISLTYAQQPSSGQVVRVKVPSAMMVDLGVVPTVEKPTSLVDAEVILGDDGMTHAIRFIRGR